jgi:hypothetical protein
VRDRVVTVLEAKIRVPFTFPCGDAFGVTVCILGAVHSPTSREVAHGAVAVSPVLALPFAAVYAARGAEFLPSSAFSRWKIFPLRWFA